MVEGVKGKKKESMYILFREREEEQEAMRLMGNVQQVND